MERETLTFDVVIIGAGPAGLAAAIKLRQLNSQCEICILEKGAEVGAHILSGAVLEPRSLNELIPDWQSRAQDLLTPVTDDQFLLLTENYAWRLPTPAPMKNHGNYIISLGNLCRWLAREAEQLGIHIFPGFPAVDFIYNNNQEVCGVLTGDRGIGKDNQPTAHYQPGIAIHAKAILLAEGCRGSLTKKIIQQFNLNKNADPQTYGLGIKELWEIDAAKHQPGKVIHTIGWPLDHQTYGGSFLYHMSPNQIAVGFVVGLDYANPYLDPFAELQRFKLHPVIRPIFTHGKRIAYGARSLSEGGWQSLPQLYFPGGLLIGDAAGFLNVPKIKGIHMAIKSGMVAAETLHAGELSQYENHLKQSWLWDELYRARNIRPGFRWGLWPGLINAAIDAYLFKGKAPWTLHHKADYLSLRAASKSRTIYYPKPDNIISFDKLSSVYLSNTNHVEDQPCHLRLRDLNIPIKINYELYAGPEARYCPAQVYEFVSDDKVKKHLQINAQNCLHCKACDIKDPSQNIDWVPPEGGGGPNYPNM